MFMVLSVSSEKTLDARVKIMELFKPSVNMLT